MPKIPDKSNVLLGGRNYKRECNAKEVCLQLQQKYVQTVYPVCPVLCSMIKQEGAYRVPNIPKMNHPMLDSILKILVVFEGLMQLRPDLETAVWCVHSENFLKERIDLIRHDLSALPQWLERDFPETSKECKELGAELKLAELRYTMNGGSCGYLLPDDIEFGNWATFLEWRERELRLAQSKGFSQEIEVNQLTCHYPAEAIKATNKIYDELRPLVKILSEQAKQSNRDKIEQNQMLAGFLQKPAGTGQENEAVKEPIAETWKQISIEVVDDDTLRYKINGENWVRVNYAEFGFMDKRKGSPKQLWPIFCEMAKRSSGGYITMRTPQNISKDIDRIRDTLRNFFGIKEIPMKYKTNKKAYEVYFNFGYKQDS